VDLDRSAATSGYAPDGDAVMEAIARIAAQ
jgi:hypothetical protein